VLEGHLGSSGDEHDSTISTIPYLHYNKIVKGRGRREDVPGVGPDDLDHQETSIG